MELPAEIVSIIREYSAPCFKYFREYKSILRLSRFAEWVALKRALETNPDKVLPSLRAYETAQIEWLKVLDRSIETWSNLNSEDQVVRNYRTRKFQALVHALRNGGCSCEDRSDGVPPRDRGLDS